MASPPKKACGMRYHFTGAKCWAISELGSKTCAFFIYVTNTVRRPKITKNTSLACERERRTGATTVDITTLVRRPEWEYRRRFNPQKSRRIVVILSRGRRGREAGLRTKET